MDGFSGDFGLIGTRSPRMVIVFPRRRYAKDTPPVPDSRSLLRPPPAMSSTGTCTGPNCAAPAPLTPAEQAKKTKQRRRVIAGVIIGVFLLGLAAISARSLHKSSSTITTTKTVKINAVNLPN
jgi:hypothetical protein